MARPRRSFQGRRRAKAWDDGPGGTGVTEFAATGSAILGSGRTSNVADITLARLRGACQVFLQTAAGAGEGFHGAVGVAIVTSAAFAAGVASVPTPITERGWDGWLYHQFFDIHAAEATTANVVQAATGNHRWDVDSKAMRKLEADMTLMAVAEVVEIGTATMDIFFDSRVLFLLA